jgi:glycosyltransferase involved in cell wall biosynthesis
MKVYFDNSIFEIQKYGGVTTYFYNLIRMLREYNIEVKTFSGFSINSNFYYNDKSIHNIYLKKYPKYFTKIIKNLNKVNNFFLTKFYKPTVYHQTYYQSFPAILPKKCQKIITIHDLIYEKNPHKFNYKELLIKKKTAILNADKIICVSQATKNDFLKYYPIKKQIFTIHHGGDHLNKSKINNFIPRKNSFILFVGQRDRHKNFINFLYAYKISKNIFNNIKIVCFGGGLFSKKEIDLFNKLRIKPDYISNIQGDKKTLCNLYKTASCLIYPSTDEGFGLPLLEAMSFGCPVIASKIKPILEIAGDAALYFDPFDYNNMSTVLEKSFEIDLKKLITNGYNNIKKFSWEKCAKLTLDVYQNK